MAKQQTQNVAEAVNIIVNYLSNLNVPIIVEQETLNVIANCNFPAVPRHELSKFCDLLIVIGGDGRLLSASRSAAKQNLPIIGINLGTLGFLADIPLNNINKIGEILNGHYYEEQRFLLETTVQNQQKLSSTKIENQPPTQIEQSNVENQNTKSIIGQDIALNDIVMTAVTAGRMIKFALHIDDKLVCSYRADGLIISTPTGSTAHALSGGGPILHPSLNAIAIVPMFSHNLSSRPIVISSASTLKLTPTPKNNEPIKITCDGQNEIIVPPKSEVTIKKAQEKLCLIHPADYDYFTSLRVKLGWER